jgi:hypothetical protein
MYVACLADVSMSTSWFMPHTSSSGICSRCPVSRIWLIAHSENNSRPPGKTSAAPSLLQKENIYTVHGCCWADQNIFAIMSVPFARRTASYLKQIILIRFCHWFTLLRLHAKCVPYLIPTRTHLRHYTSNPIGHWRGEKRGEKIYSHFHSLASKNKRWRSTNFSQETKGKLQ